MQCPRQGVGCCLSRIRKSAPVLHETPTRIFARTNGARHTAERFIYFKKREKDQKPTIPPRDHRHPSQTPRSPDTVRAIASLHLPLERIFPRRTQPLKHGAQCLVQDAAGAFAKQRSRSWTRPSTVATRARGRGKCTGMASKIRASPSRFANDVRHNAESFTPAELVRTGCRQFLRALNIQKFKLTGLRIQLIFKALHQRTNL